LVFWADDTVTGGGEGHCGVSVGPVTSGSADRLTTFGKKVKLLRNDDQHHLILSGKALAENGVDTANIVVSRYVDQWPNKPSSHKSIHGQYQGGSEHPGSSYVFLGVSKVWLPKNAKSDDIQEGGGLDDVFYESYLSKYNIPMGSVNSSPRLVYDCLRKVNFSPEIAAILTCIAERESSFCPGQINPYIEETKDYSFGLFQMNLLNVFNQNEASIDPNRNSYTLPFIRRENVGGVVKESVDSQRGTLFAYYPSDDFVKKYPLFFMPRKNDYPGIVVKQAINAVHSVYVKGKTQAQVNANKDIIKQSLSYIDEKNPVLWQPINQAMMARTFWSWSHGTYESLSQVPEITKPFATGNYSSGLYHWGGYRNSNGTFAKASGFIFQTKYETARAVLVADLKINFDEARERIEKAIKGESRRIYANYRR